MYGLTPEERENVLREMRKMKTQPESTSAETSRLLRLQNRNQRRSESLHPLVGRRNHQGERPKVGLWPSDEQED